MSTRMRTPEETIRLAARLYAAGAFQKDVAAAVKRSASAIKVWRTTSPIWRDEMEKYPWIPADRKRVRKTGYTNLSRYPSTLVARNVWIVKMYCEEKHSTREIGRALHMEGTTIVQILRASGGDYKRHQVGRGFVPEPPETIRAFGGDTSSPPPNKYDRMHERRDRIRRDFEQGRVKLASAYAKEYGLHPTTIYKDMKALGLHPAALTRKPRGT